jgi:hypothetical protein
MRIGIRQGQGGEFEDCLDRIRRQVHLVRLSIGVDLISATSPLVTAAACSCR